MTILSGRAHLPRSVKGLGKEFRVGREDESVHLKLLALADDDGVGELVGVEIPGGVRIHFCGAAVPSLPVGEDIGGRELTASKSCGRSRTDLLTSCLCGVEAFAVLGLRRGSHREQLLRSRSGFWDRL